MNQEDESKRESEVARGGRARQITEDPMFKEAADGLEQLYYNTWRNSSADQVEERERLYLMYKSMVDFRNTFIRIIKTGDMAQAQLEAKKEPGVTL